MSITVIPCHCLNHIDSLAPLEEREWCIGVRRCIMLHHNVGLRVLSVLGLAPLMVAAGLIQKPASGVTPLNYMVHVTLCDV